jgi:hypothetical protein
VLQSSGGGSVTIANWFDGANQVSIQAPDGSVWASADIAAQFRPPTYSITYANLPVVHAEDALNMFMSYCRPLTDFYIPGDNRWNDDTRLDNLSNMASQTWGDFKPDASGTWYLSTSNSFTYNGATSNVWFQTDHGTFQGSYWVKGSVDMSWDRWTDASGQEWVALTNVNNHVVIEGDWMEPPTLDTPYWTQHSQLYNYYPVTGTGERTVTLVDPGVDHVVLGSQPSAQVSIMGLRGLVEPTSTMTASATTTTAHASLSAVGDSSDVAQLLAHLFDAGTLSVWEDQLHQAQAHMGGIFGDQLAAVEGLHTAISLIGVAQQAHDGAALMLA